MAEELKMPYISRTSRSITLSPFTATLQVFCRDYDYDKSVIFNGSENNRC